MSKKKLLVMAALAANALSYFVAQQHWEYNSENGAELVRRRAENGDDKTMVYLVAGCGNQPEQAFDFLMSDLRDYNKTFVNYKPYRGCDMRLIADQIIEDVDEHGFQRVLIIDCSIGDYVGRVCEEELGERVYTIAINPEPSAELLQPWAKKVLKIGLPIGRAMSFAAGWLSQIPFYSDCGNRFSSGFMLGQFEEIANRTDAPKATDHMLGAILAVPTIDGEGGDEFLVGFEEMDEYFGGKVKLYTATGASHSNTVNEATLYKSAWAKLWKDAEPRFEAALPQK